MEQLNINHDVEEVQEYEGFEIHDTDSLNWAFRKLNSIKVKQADVKAVADKERARINEWEAAELKKDEGFKERLTFLIQLYHQKQLEQDPKAKTLSTPYGKSKTRRSAAAPEKANEEELLQYVQENELFDFIKQSVKWADVKKTFKVVQLGEELAVVDENGQLVPGVTVKPESINFSLEV